MLQTDLHNPSIAEEKKMDKAGFLRNNRGINDGKDLPEDYMGAIFDRIKATPISLKEDDDFRSRRGGPAPSAASSLLDLQVQPQTGCAVTPTSRSVSQWCASLKLYSSVGCQHQLVRSNSSLSPRVATARVHLLARVPLLHSGVEMAHRLC